MTSPSETVLRPCAHCGGEAATGQDYEAWFVQCVDSECGISTPLRVTLENAVALWNHRTIASKVVAQAVAREANLAVLNAAPEVERLRAVNAGMAEDLRLLNARNHELLERVEQLRAAPEVVALIGFVRAMADEKNWDDMPGCLRWDGKRHAIEWAQNLLEECAALAIAEKEEEESDYDSVTDEEWAEYHKELT